VSPLSVKICRHFLICLHAIRTSTDVYHADFENVRNVRFLEPHTVPFFITRQYCTVALEKENYEAIIKTEGSVPESCVSSSFYNRFFSTSTRRHTRCERNLCAMRTSDCVAFSMAEITKPTLSGLYTAESPGCLVPRAAESRRPWLKWWALSMRIHSVCGLTCFRCGS
jgi:hypothetical protein